MLEKFTAFLLPTRLWLEAHGGAGTSFGVLCTVLFLTMYLLRKWSPTAKLWERVARVIPAIDFDMTPGLTLLSKMWQGCFPTMVAAAVGALASGTNPWVAAVAALAGPVTVFGHEFLKWLPWLSYRGQVNPVAFVQPAKKAPSIPPIAACFAMGFLMALAACTGLGQRDASTAKTIDSIAHDLCLMTFVEAHANLSVTDVAKDFCSTEEQLSPFIQQLRMAKIAAMQPPPEEAKKVTLSGCDLAVDNAKKLGCPIEAGDAGGWCSTRSSAEVSCMVSLKTTSCLAFVKCTEAKK